MKLLGKVKSWFRKKPVKSFKAATKPVPKKWKKPRKIPYKIPKRKLKEDRRVVQQLKAKEQYSKLKALKRILKLERKSKINKMLQWHIERQNLIRKERKKQNLIRKERKLKKKGYVAKIYYYEFYAEKEDEQGIFSVWTVAYDTTEELTDDIMADAFFKAQIEEVGETGWMLVSYRLLRVKYVHRKQRCITEWL